MNIRLGNLLRLAGVFLIFGSSGLAQDLLPPGGFAPEWTASGKPRVFIEKDLFNHIDGGAELYLEFGFAKVLVQTYAAGSSELDFELYEMTEPDAALGIYLMNAGRETPWAEIPARNSSEEAQVVAVKGRYYLKINNFAPGATLRPAMISLARAALSRLPDAPSGVPLTLLPSAGLIPGSGRLIRGPVGLLPIYTFGEGDILGLNGQTFAALGEYRAEDGSTFKRIVADYPSDDAAAAVLRNLRDNLDPYLKITAQKSDGFDFVDFQKTFGRVERRGPRLEILFKRKALSPIS